MTESATTEDAPEQDDPKAGASTKTFTQEQVNDLIAREKGQIQGRYADYDELKSKAEKLAEIEDATKSEAEKLSGERDSFKSEAEATKAENLRLRVAMEKKLPAELIDRLRGGTKEEMEADADKLLELVKPANVTDFDGGVRQPAPTGGDMNAVLRRAAGQA